MCALAQKKQASKLRCPPPQKESVTGMEMDGERRYLTPLRASLDEYNSSRAKEHWFKEFRCFLFSTTNYILCFIFKMPLVFS